MSQPVITLDSVAAAYGLARVVSGVSFEIQPGEAVALLGRNGAGKTTLLRTIVGLHPAAAGAIRFEDREVTGMRAARRVRAGIGYVPQGRGILPHLTVEENLRLGLAARASDTRIPAYVFDWFPALERLRGRKGGLLSGGEAQQLSLARALVTKPRLLILDEPTEGIQPSVVQQMQDTLGRIRRELGVAILLVEQYLAFAWAVAARFHVMSGGRIVDSGETATRPHESVAHLINI